MNNQLKALIVDDEALACDMLDYLIKHHVAEITQVKKCTNPAEAIELLKTYSPDILFLDVQMPFMNGFEMLSQLPSHHFSVIFTTAYDKYAIKAIRFSALDYLLKPVDTDELKMAVERHAQRLEQNENSKAQYEYLKYNMNAESQQHYKLALRDKDRIRLVHPSEIVHCEALNNYTKFFLVDKSIIVTSKTIKEYEEMLKEYRFIRTHKSHLVNAVFIKMISHNYQHVIMNDATKIEISRRRKEDIIEFLKS